MAVFRRKSPQVVGRGSGRTDTPGRKQRQPGSQARETTRSKEPTKQRSKTARPQGGAKGSPQGNGRRNAKKRWWYDLEVVDRISVLPKGTNERDLNLDKVIRAADQKLAHFPADMMPPPDHRDPFPLDREAGLRRAAAAETPDAARRRLKVP